MRQKSGELKPQGTESEDKGADAAQAFEALQAEVALQRRAIEALGDGLEGQTGQPWSDLSQVNHGIAQILQNQAQLLEGVEALTAYKDPSVLTVTPTQQTPMISQSDSGLIREAVLQLQQATQQIQHERSQLAHGKNATGISGPKKQFLLWTGGAALAAGLILSPLLIRSLPVTLSSQVAAFMVKEDRWVGGALLMRMEHPLVWPSVTEALRLTLANEAALTGCRSLAVKTRHEQRCTIVIPNQ